MLKEIKNWAVYILVLVGLIVIVGFMANGQRKKQKEAGQVTMNLEQQQKEKKEEEENLVFVRENLTTIKKAEEYYPTKVVEEEVLVLLEEIRRTAERNNLRVKRLEPLMLEQTEEMGLANVDTVVTVVGAYHDIVDTLGVIERFSKASYITGGEIDFKGGDSLEATIIITSLARPKIEAKEVTSISNLDNREYTIGSVPFGQFVDFEKKRQEELAKLQEDENNYEGSKDTGVGIFIEDTEDTGYIEVLEYEDEMVYIDESVEREEHDPRRTVFDERYAILKDWGWVQESESTEKEFHYGVNIAAPEGTIVKSLGVGKVLYKGDMQEYGSVVMIEYTDGVVSMYANMGRIRVDIGDKVIEGTAVGTVGATGKKGETYLHLGVAVEGEFINPREYVRIE